MCGLNSRLTEFHDSFQNLPRHISADHKAKQSSEAWLRRICSVQWVPWTADLRSCLLKLGEVLRGEHVDQQRNPSNLNVSLAETQQSQGPGLHLYEFTTDATDAPLKVKEKQISIYHVKYEGPTSSFKVCPSPGCTGHEALALKIAF